MIRKIFTALFLVFLFLGGAQAQQTLNPQLRDAMSKVQAGDIKKDIAYLADDKLLGRSPGTPGYRQAADYVSSRLQANGVQPAGDGGSWLQAVRLRRAIPTLIWMSENRATGERDPLEKTAYSVYPSPTLPKVNVSGQLAFVGYGISEPKLAYDSYKELDVKGKIVIVIRGAPTAFSSSAAAHVGNISTIVRAALQHGAVGVILASADTAIKNAPNLGAGTVNVLDAKGKVAVSRTHPVAKAKLLAAINAKLLGKWLDSAGKNLTSITASLAKGEIESFDLPVTISASVSSRYEDFESFNVVGKIEGSDPKLKKEYVVHSAHLDHLGVARPIEGDSIYNGAHDNASGVASVLAISKIYKEGIEKLRRSILFVLVTGEELGLLGSAYFAASPTVPRRAIVADINTDMPTIITPLLSITALGADHSSLKTTVAQAAGALNLTVEPDPEPAQARFTRSDQYSFVAAGIPALHVKYGSKTADGKNNLNDMVAEWRKKYYHKPQDDINGIFDFEAGVKYAQLNFLIGYLVANETQKPTWNKGDVFE